MSVYDLHCHSTASDGVLSPRDLVNRAKAHGVNVLGLTDHDTLAGLQEAEQAAAEFGVKLIPGVEISVSWNKRVIHILGLGIDRTNADLIKGLNYLRQQRIARAQEIAHRLEKLGVPGAWQGAIELAGEGNVTRTHFARYVVSIGKARTMQDVFDKYLSSGKPAYVGAQWAVLGEAVGWIIKAGGQAVVAHPSRYRMTATVLRSLLTEFKDCGGTGLEVVSGGCGLDVVQNNAELAHRFELLGSAGSDFHSPEQDWIELGKLHPLPKKVTAVWEQCNW